MSRIDVIRAWKDQAYRQSLSDAERASLPENPAGSVELTEAEADAVVGGLAALACGCGCHTHGLVLNNFNKYVNVMNW
jgi:mersacidin/lichenicidin family type 2 lantibiotic